MTSKKEKKEKKKEIRIGGRPHGGWRKVGRRKTGRRKPPFPFYELSTDFICGFPKPILTVFSPSTISLFAFSRKRKNEKRNKK